jgi:hypothetical protein
MTDLFDPNSLPPVQEAVKFEDLVGDGKKFRDPDDLARGKLEADKFIERLKQENADIRRQLSSEERLEEIKELLERSNAPSRNDNQTDPNPSVNGQKPPFNPEDLEQLLEHKLAQREAKARQEANLELSRKGLVDAFGNDYPSILEQKARELGMNKQVLSNLAVESPQAFLRLVGADQPKPRVPDLFTPPTSNMRTVPSTGVTGERTYKYYQDLKTKEPRQYWDARTQIQMEKDAQRLGPAFFN